MRVKQFFYLCAGILMLAVAYTLGANRAQWQAPGCRVTATAANGAPCLRLPRGWSGFDCELRQPSTT